ncbi:phage portal protein [Planobispora rosea]|uniref:phage portal protein n=1 Tax=Planobispora rosea TaxID=35762 RepID=UPI00083ABF81|nr:phage portal protein [Planobispora rosea]
MLDDTPLSPDWWLLRLGRKLRDRQRQLNHWWDYYSGNPPLPTGPKGPASVYLDFQRKSRTNFLKAVVGASVHRLLAIGVTDANGQADAQAWLWWQQNRMDSRQKKLWRTALSQSESYVIVGPHPRDERRPLITPEHPREVIVEHDPATGERLAALKAWYDDIEQVGKATVYLPDMIVKYRTPRRSGGRALPWGTESWELRQEAETNPLGEVPVVPFTCAPDLGEDPLPDFAQGIDIQDRINLSMLNRMTAERYSAFRQKYVTGHKFKTVTDPETGLPILDPITGQPQIEQPFRPDPGSLWASTGENVKFGEFSQTDLLGYLKVHQADILDLLILTHTPAYYYAGDLINVSSDTVLALDTNHVAKIGEYQTGFGESLEDMFGLAAKIAQVDRDYTASEVRWKDPRQINPGALADYGVKLKSIGYPLGVVAEKLGESPQMVKRITAGQAQESFLAAALNPAAQQQSVRTEVPEPDSLT